MPGTGHLLMPSGPCAWDVRWGFCWCSTNIRILSKNVSRAKVWSFLARHKKIFDLLQVKPNIGFMTQLLALEIQLKQQGIILVWEKSEGGKHKRNETSVTSCFVGCDLQYKYKGFCAVCLSKNFNFLFNIQYIQYIDRQENNYFQIDCTPWDKTWCIVYTQ